MPEPHPRCNPPTHTHTHTPVPVALLAARCDNVTQTVRPNVVRLGSTDDEESQLAHLMVTQFTAFPWGHQPGVSYWS